jgi:twitching motility protein PilT
VKPHVDIGPIPPPLSASDLLGRLREDDILDDQQMVSLLGVDRHELSLKTLEVALVRDHILSSPELLDVIGHCTTRPVLADRDATPVTTLPSQVAKDAGAVCLAGDTFKVAMVEDTRENLQRVANELGTADFEVFLVTVNQFADLYRAVYTSAEVRDRPEAADIYEVLDEAVRRRASDVHLAVGQPPVLRIDGALVALPRQPLSEEWIERNSRAVIPERRFANFKESYSVDAAYTFGSSRFRINVGADRYGPTIALRKLPTQIPTTAMLDLPDVVCDFATLERGLVLVTGPTGSGKSTTLAALLNSIATDQGRHIITLEDPIEFLLNSHRSIVHQRELGESFSSFADGLRQALRQDPDVILVGEMRDLETMRAAITAAETGHLVFGTLHTFDATSTLGRLVSAFPAEEQEQIRSQLAYILKGVVSQTLLPLTTGSGRVAAFEIMVSTPAISNNLRKVDGLNAIRQTIEVSTRDGMQTMDMALADLVAKRRVSLEEAEFRARNLEEFHRRLGQGGVQTQPS